MGAPRKTWSCAAALCILLFTRALSADALLLKDGSRVTGRFLSVDEQGYHFETGGKTQLFPLSQVSKLLIEPETRESDAASGRQDSGLWMTLVLPGWAQAASGRPGTGYTLGGLFLASAALAAGSGWESRHRYGDYKQRSREALFLVWASPNSLYLGTMALTYPDLQKRRVAVEKAQNRAWTWLGVSAVVYVIGIADYQIKGTRSTVTFGPGTIAVIVSL